MAEKKTEDIIDRLEALRKRVPEEKKPAAAQPPPTPERAKKARIIGLVVVLLIAFGVLGVLYKFVLQPKASETLERVQEEQVKLEQERLRREEERKAFLEAKNKKIAEINDAFEGLPPTYTTAKSELKDKANAAKDMSGLNVINVEAAANDAWRSYRLAQTDTLLAAYKEVELKADGDVFRSVLDIKQRIQALSYVKLKNVTLRELRYEYVPMRLMRVPAGGLPKENTTLNIYFKQNENETVYLARDARLVSILRAKSSAAIGLSESEERSKTGGGVEGVGVVPSLAIGSTTATLTGTFAGSAGTAMSKTQTTLTLDLTEVQKAYAARKISESDFKAMLDKYGIRLGVIEETTNVGVFDVEYLLLVRVTSDEAPGLVSKLFTQADRDKIQVTFTTWSPSQ